MVESKIAIKNYPSQAIKELEKIAANLKGPSSVKVGLPKNSNAYPDGTSVIMVATVHEFGSPAKGIQERSFLRATLTTNRTKYKSAIKRLAKGIGTGKLKPVKAMSVLGVMLEADVRATITDEQLIETSHLRQSVTHIVGAK